MGKGKFPDADGQFSNSLYFNLNDGKLHFDNNWADNAIQNFGSTSGFLGQSLLLTKKHRLLAMLFSFFKSI